MLLTEHQMSDQIGAEFLYLAPPEITLLIADKGYDNNEFRHTLNAKRIAAYIPPKRNRRLPSAFDKTIYKQCHMIKNMFDRTTD